MQRVEADSFYRQYALSLTRLAALLTGSREAAEDVVQDVFARMHQRWNSFDTNDQALAYARASVVNGTKNLKRRRQYSVPAEPPHPSTMSAEAEVMKLAQQAVVRAAVDSLPHRQREVIALRYLVDMSVADTAKALGITEGAVKASCGRARSTLLNLLRDEYDR